MIVTKLHSEKEVSTMQRILKYYIAILLTSYLIFVIWFRFSVINSYVSIFVHNDGDDIKTVFKRVKFVTNCTDNIAKYKIEKRNKYWVLYNYFLSLKRFKCEESVTYATYSDHTLLDNLLPLVERWRGPISFAVQVSGKDYKTALKYISYLRECAPLVREYITFHIVFLDKRSPEKVVSYNDAMKMTYDCHHKPPPRSITQKNIHLINVARNVAQSMSETHYVLTSDIELLPSVNLIPKFLKMIANFETSLRQYYPAVFILHLFEIDSGLKVPEHKSELQKLFKGHVVTQLQRRMCYKCNELPGVMEWMNTEENKYMDVFGVVKRVGKQKHLEPVYISTRDEFYYDESLNWEGMKDRMTQAYKMCLLDYSFLILEDAFLIRRRKIEKIVDNTRRRYMWGNFKLVQTVIFPNITQTYGINPECKLLP